MNRLTAMKPKFLIKPLALLSVLSGLLIAGIQPLKAQNTQEAEKLGLPGDNFNLAAALDVFQQSPTLEAFEKKINEEGTKLNNLDLNNDNKTDYVKVIDKVDGDLHSIILQVDINKNESQDIAVIFVEKKGDNITVQMVGDEDLYGKDYVIEPASDKKQSGTINPGYTGNDTYVTNNYYYSNENNQYSTQPSYAPSVVTWPVITFMFAPVYRPWVCPYGWGYYPGWYNPWRPWYWDTYYNHWYYHHSWNGWWYWRPPYAYHPYHGYGYYSHYRMRSPVYRSYQSQGYYRTTYQNPRPAPRPTTPARYPSHSVSADKNPAIVRPTTRPVSPATINPGNPGTVNPGTRPGQQPTTRPGEMPQQPTTRPGEMPQQPTTRPGEMPQQPTTRPGEMPQQPSTRPAPSTRPSEKPQTKPSYQKSPSQGSYNRSSYPSTPRSAPSGGRSSYGGSSSAPRQR